MLLRETVADNPFTAAARVVGELNPDAELAEAARALAHKSITLAQYYLDHGSPQVQLQVIKTIMPAIGRAMSERGENEELVAMREQLAQLHTLLLGQAAS